jgi:drug/metabolite transporter (DMT)-like permease
MGCSTVNKGYLYLALTILIFGPFEVISKLIHGIDAVQLNFLRFLIGGAALLPFALHDIRSKRKEIRKRDLVYMAGLGVLYIPVSMAVLQVAIQNTSASLATFVISVTPVFIAIFAAWILHERPNAFVVGAIGLELVGLFFIANPFTETFDFYFLYLFFAAAVFSLYNVLMRNVTSRFGNLASVTMVVIFGTAALGLFLLVSGIPLFEGVSSANALPIIYLGVFGSGIAFVCYYKGMALTTTNVGSIVFFLKPIEGTIYAILILNERLTAGFVTGAALILLGSVIMIFGKERRAPVISAT